MIRLALVLALGGCSGLGSRAQWNTVVVQAPFDRVWDACLEALRIRGWEIRTSDRARGRIETAWRERLSPHRYEGFREKASFELYPEGPSATRLRYQVVRQINEAVFNTQSSSEARWSGDTNDPDKELELKYLIDLKLQQ